jgi:hypothetical protein
VRSEGLIGTGLQKRHVVHVVEPLLFAVFILVVVGLIGALLYTSSEARKQLRHTAYQEEIGEAYDLELNRLHEIESLRPKDAPYWTNSWEQAFGTYLCKQALVIVRLQKRKMEKNILSHESTRPVTFNLSNSTIAALNLGNVLGDLTASVQNLETHGAPKIADAIEKLASAISESKEIKDADRKDLLENVALVSNEVSSEPDRRRPGLLKSSLGFITASLATANELIPVVHELHEKLKAAGIINW